MAAVLAVALPSCSRADVLELVADMTHGLRLWRCDPCEAVTIRPVCRSCGAAGDELRGEDLAAALADDEIGVRVGRA